jgi:hypothetical protein
MAGASGAAPVAIEALGAPHATPDVREFLLRVLAWPGDDDPGYVNVHVQMRHLDTSKTNGRRLWTGSPTRNVDKFLEQVRWYMGWSVPPDVYMCMSRQANVKAHKDGRNRAAKSREGALALKAIFLDIDCYKAPPAGYLTVEEAVDALDKFTSSIGIPPPTALVSSGGGLHAYWISDRPLTVEEWSQYAEGLKNAAQANGLFCDLGVTADAARVLRVPGTFNYKKDQPRRVAILRLSPHDLDFATALAPLQTVSAPRVHAGPTSWLLAERPDPAFGAVSSERLSLGIDKYDETPLPIGGLFASGGCPHFQDAFTTRGAGYSQGLWNLDVLACTFLEDGNELAHLVSKGHAGYNRDDTEALWERKLAERKSRGLGWPSCKAIQSVGCQQCAGCPHLAAGKSPLSLAGIQSPAVAPPPALNDNARPPEDQSNPAARLLMMMRDGGTDLDALLKEMNESFAVVRHGGQTLVARISSNDITSMKVEDFHRMFANLVVYEEVKEGNTTKKRRIRVSQRWFEWKDRRQHLGRGVVFEPGGPLQVDNDMLNLWRGFGVEPKQGDWSLMRAHILNVICGEDQALCDYVIKWMAYGVQHPDRPVDVNIATRGEEGAGKGFLWRNYGKLYGKHFKHVVQGEQLTGTFNGVLGDTCAVFLDEALWAGDARANKFSRR